ncbi:MAG: DUF2147 domain-containing protein [Pseudomonadota bacterium]
MKKLFLAAALVSAPALVQADDVFGQWASEPNDEGGYIVVDIKACGEEICGTIIDAKNGADASVVGKPIIWEMKARGNGSYRGGTIWAPDTDKEYRSKMSLSGNNLSVSGCVGPICRSQNWSRVN